MDQDRATKVLQRFDTVIRTVARQVNETFTYVTELEDVVQDASLLVLSYAGLAPSQYGRGHVGSLADIELDRNENQIQNVVATQLRLDLNRYYGREADKRMSTISINNTHENYIPPTFDIHDALSKEADFKKRYPTLYLWLADDMSGDQIAEFAGVTVRTVERRIAKEKLDYLRRYARRGGLRVVGDESVDELQEACGHLKLAGR